jgi:sialidase-1
MASLIRFEYIENGKKKTILLFSNPDHQYERRRITIKASLDDGLTWPSAYHLLLDEGGGRGYSSLTQIDDETIAILYEGSQANMVFEKVHINEILKN